MPFKANDSETQVVKGRTLYTGIANWQIVTVNPNEAEREKLGITQKVSDYVGEDKNKNPQIRLDFWLKLKKIPYKSDNLDVEKLRDFRLQRLSLFLSNTPVESTDNKFWINRQGVTTWAPSKEALEGNPSMSWYDTVDVRQVLQGEDRITKLLIAYLNVDTRAEGVQARLDDPTKIAKGSVKEIKDVIKEWKDNTVQCLLGVSKTDKGTFQDFYKDFFARTTSKLKTLETWKRAINDDRLGLSTRWYEDFEVQNLKFSEYETSTEVGSEASASNYSAPPPSGGDDTDDLPF